MPTHIQDYAGSIYQQVIFSEEQEILFSLDAQNKTIRNLYTYEEKGWMRRPHLTNHTLSIHTHSESANIERSQAQNFYSSDDTFPCGSNSCYVSYDSLLVIGQLTSATYDGWVIETVDYSMVGDGKDFLLEQVGNFLDKFDVDKIDMLDKAIASDNNEFALQLTKMGVKPNYQLLSKYAHDEKYNYISDWLLGSLTSSDYTS